MGSTIELNVQTVTAGQMGPIVRLKAFRGWTIGHAKAALEERGCGPAAQIKLIQQGSTPANDTLLTDLDNPAGIIAATPMAPTKDSSTPVDDSVIELNLRPEVMVEDEIGHMTPEATAAFRTQEHEIDMRNVEAGQNTIPPDSPWRPCHQIGTPAQVASSTLGAASGAASGGEAAPPAQPAAEPVPCKAADCLCVFLGPLYVLLLVPVTLPLAIAERTLILAHSGRSCTLFFPVGGHVCTVVWAAFGLVTSVLQCLLQAPCWRWARSSPFDLRKAKKDDEAYIPYLPNYAMHFLFESFGAGGADFGRKLLGARPLTQDSLEQFREIILAKWVDEDENPTADPFGI